MTESDRQIIIEAQELVRLYVPRFKLRVKATSTLIKIIGVLVWPFNKNFMSDFVTTIYPCVYIPDDAFMTHDVKGIISVLFHEMVHLCDRKRQGVWFSLKYLFPQILSVIPILGLLTLAWLSIPNKAWVMGSLGLLTALCLMPWPAPWRKNTELRGYTMSMAVMYWTHKNLPEGMRLSPATCEAVIANFTGWNYYKMWNFKNSMKREIDGVVRNIRYSELNDQPFLDVRAFIEERFS